MINTSSEFKTAVKAASRKTAGRVIFSVVDPDSIGASTNTVSQEGIISKKDQLTDEITEIQAKYANFELNYWRLDGTFVLPPKPEETGFQNGWWSEDLSDANGNISSTLTFDFSIDITSAGLTIFFDTKTNNYAEDFTINVYDSGDTLVYTENVVGNSNAKYKLEQELNNYQKVEIILTKVNEPYRRARVTEVAFGLVERFDGQELIDMSIIEEIDPVAKEVTTNEVTFTIDNKDKRFNILNPDGIVEFLERRQKITPEIGVETSPDIFEYVPMGVYYLKDWKSNEGTLTASFTARDALDLASDSLYRKGDIANTTLYDLAVDILDDAGIDDYTVDTSLQSITVKGYLEIMSHREALQKVASAGEAVVYSDRDGFIQVKQLSNAPLSYQIDFDNVFSDPSITLEKLINQVDVDVHTFSTEGSTETIYDDSIDINGTVDVWAEYSDPADNVVASVTGGTLNTVNYYSNAMLLNITASGTVDISATGNKLNIGKTPIQTIDQNKPAGEKDLTLKITNTLINSNARASSVGTYVLNEVQKRNIHDVNWRQDPSLEAGDIINVEDEFGVNEDGRILDNEFTFRGALSGKTKVKGE